MWVLGDGKSGQLGLGPDVVMLGKLTRLPPLSSLLPARTERRTTNFTLSRDGAQKMKAASWNRNFGAEEEVASVHAGPLTSAIITSMYWLLVEFGGNDANERDSKW